MEQRILINLFILALGIAIGAYAGYNTHEYEICSEQYDVPEDILECVWIRQN